MGPLITALPDYYASIRLKVFRNARHMTNRKTEPEAQLAAMIANTSMAFIVTDPGLPDNPIIMCNAAFMKVTGYAKDEIIGRNCRFLTGQDTESSQTKLVVEAMRAHEPVLVQITNYKKDGSPFQNGLMVAPTFDDEGELAYFLGSQMELPPKPDLALQTESALASAKIKLLTPQQKRVLSEVAKGYMNKQIAHTLDISESTVKMHRSEALSRMDVSTTAEAIRLAVLAGL